MAKVITIIAPDGDNLFFYGQSLNDTLVAGNGIQTLYGNAGNDLLVAGTGTQSLYGGSGDDTIIAGMGNQIYDGGAGNDTIDFSALNARVEVDQDLYFANIFDPQSGALLATSRVTSFTTVIGSQAGTIFWASEYTSRSYIGGAGNDAYYSESGGDTVTLGAGADTFRWYRKYVADGLVDHITDFTVGVDKLDLRDFLKGQGIKNPAYSAVVHLADTVDADGTHSTLVTGLVDGVWREMAVLDGVNVATVAIADLVL